MRTRWLGAALTGAAIGMMAVGAVALIDRDGSPNGPIGDAAAPTTNPSTGNVVSRTITVSGEGHVKVKPDTASLNVGVQANADTATAALAQANDAAEKLIAALKAAGIADDDLTTAGLSVYPNYSANNKINGYQANNSVQVTIRDIGRTGPVIDAAAAAAGDNITIGGVSFYVDDTEKLIGAARADAIANALKRAGEYAAAAGVKVGGVLQIAEVSVSPVPIYSYERAAADSAGGSKTPIQIGTQDLSVNVTVVYELA